MKARIFVDGHEGTTGLQIHERLAQRSELELLAIDSEKRKDTSERKRLLNQADIVFFESFVRLYRQVKCLADGLGGLPGAQERAAINGGNNALLSRQSFGQPVRLLLACLIERRVGPTLNAPSGVVGRLAVSDKQQLCHVDSNFRVSRSSA